MQHSPTGASGRLSIILAIQHLLGSGTYCHTRLERNYRDRQVSVRGTFCPLPWQYMALIGSFCSLNLPTAGRASFRLKLYCPSRSHGPLKPPSLQMLSDWCLNLMSQALNGNWSSPNRKEKGKPMAILAECPRRNRKQAVANFSHVGNNVGSQKIRVKLICLTPCFYFW